MGSIVVLGASLSGTRTVQELRRFGSTDRILLIGEEPHLPYDRPPLSKGVLSGEVESSTLQLADAAALADLDVELRLGVRAERLDPAAKRLELAGGESLEFETLVIATGTKARRLPTLPGEHEAQTLRTLEDSRRLRDRLAATDSLAIIGGGLIGGEVAATAATLGIPVTVIDPSARPFERILGQQVGALLAQQHRDSGVRFVCGLPTELVRRADDMVSIRVDDGTVVEAGVVLLAVGAEPNVELLAGSGIDHSDGIACDRYGRCAPGVWAVGDVASWTRWASGDVPPRRFEHWSNAVEQARLVGWNILHETDGPLRESDAIPYFWTDQYRSKIQIFGSPRPSDEFIEVARENDSLAGLYCRDGHVVAAVSMNAVRHVPALRRHVADRTRADAVVPSNDVA